MKAAGLVDGRIGRKLGKECFYTDLYFIVQFYPRQLFAVSCSLWMCFPQTSSETLLEACIYQDSNRPRRLAAILQIRYTNFTIMLQTITEAGDVENCPLQAVDSPVSWKSTANRFCSCQVPSGGSIRIIAPDDYDFGPVIETAATRPALSA